MASDAGLLRYVDARVTEEQLGRLSGDALDGARVEAARQHLHFLADGGGVVCHIKGFASGLGEDVAQHATVLVAWLRARQVSTIVWDGDDFAADSFTCLLPPLMKALPHVNFVAFLMHKDRHGRYGNPRGFHGAWSSCAAAATTVYLLDDSLAEGGRYERLGAVALLATQAPLVLAIGGGATALQELELTQAAGGRARWHLLNVERTGQSGDSMASSLVGVPGVAHVAITPAAAAMVGDAT